MAPKKDKNKKRKVEEPVLISEDSKSPVRKSARKTKKKDDDSVITPETRKPVGFMQSCCKLCVVKKK